MFRVNVYDKQRWRKTNFWNLFQVSNQKRNFWASSRCQIASQNWFIWFYQPSRRWGSTFSPIHLFFASSQENLCQVFTSHRSYIDVFIVVRVSVRRNCFRIWNCLRKRRGIFSLLLKRAPFPWSQGSFNFQISCGTHLETVTDERMLLHH